MRVTLALLAACGGSDPPAAPNAPPIGNLLGSLLVAADKTQAPWRCAAQDIPAVADEDITVGDQAWKLSAQRLVHTGPDRSLAIGVIADAGGSASRTIAAIGRLRAAFDAAKLDLVVSLGGMGATADELQATLGTLSERAPWPVVALPGDLEPMPAQVAAIAFLRKRGDVVLDGRNVRWIELPGATIATVPGAGATERLAPGTDGCIWQPADVAALTTELTARPGIRIVASAEAPRRTVGGEAAGALALAPTSALPIEIALHGPVESAPTPARHGGRDGAGVGLSPGTADATTRLPGAHRPSAGVLVIRGGDWTWRPLVDDK